MKSVAFAQCPFASGDIGCRTHCTGTSAGNALRHLLNMMPHRCIVGRDRRDRQAAAEPLAGRARLPNRRLFLPGVIVRLPGVVCPGWGLPGAAVRARFHRHGELRDEAAAARAWLAIASAAILFHPHNGICIVVSSVVEILCVG